MSSVSAGLDRERERALVERARSGTAAEREAAFAELFAELQAPVLALCRNLLGNAADAEDALQEVFLAVHQALPAFRGEARLKTWVYRIAIRASIRLRARRRRRTIALLEREPPAPDAGDALEAKELRLRLDAAVAALPAEYGVVLSLFAVEGLTHAAIAEILAIPIGTVWSRLHAARKRLQREIGAG